jgi:hypothetical protein
MEADVNDEQPSNTPNPIDESREPLSNVTFARLEQPVNE